MINIPIILNSLPDHEPRKIGAYLTWISMTSTCITSSMFLTALAPNILAVDLISRSTNIVITWDVWLHITIVLILPLFLITPFLVYIIYPPMQKKLPEAPLWADNELKTIGKISFQEILMAIFSFITLLAWIFAKELEIDMVIVAISIMIMMILTQVISWDDIISNKSAWNIFIWFETLVTLSSGLNDVGVIQWIGERVETSLSMLSLHMIIVSMIVTFFLLHYLFASLTAHATVLLPLFALIASRFIEAEQFITFMVLLSSTIGFMGIITPYAMGPSPIWYGAGYISQKEWWILGGVFGFIFMSVSLLGVFIFI